MKKKLLTGSLALGLMAMATPVFAGATLTEYGGTKGETITAGGLTGFSWDFAAAGIAGGLPPGTLYDNIPTLFGGTATPGFHTSFSSNAGTFAFVDWSGEVTAAQDFQWGEDVGGMAPGSQITNVWYAYSNPAASTHIIKIYDSLGLPSAFFSGAISKGALLTSITVAAAGGTGFFTVVVNLPAPVTIAGTAVWVKLGEQGDPTFGSFFLTGGTPGLGATTNGAVYGNKVAGFNSFVGGFPSFDFGFGPLYINPSIGFNVVPAPAVIGLLGLAGLVTLRRRRLR